MRLLPDIDDFFALEHGARLEGLEFERALALAPAAQLLGQRVLRAQLRLQAGHPRRLGGQIAPAFKPGGDAVIGQLGLVAHPGAVNRRAGQLAVGPENHFGHQRQPVLAGVERGEVGRKALGQHRENAGRGVHRGRVEPGMVVDGRALFDQRIDVGNGHQQLDGAARQRFADGQLVQVQRIVVVDGTPQQSGQVLDSRRRFASGTGEQGQLLADAVRELGLQSAFGHGAGGNTEEVGALVGAVGVHRITIAPTAMPDVPAFVLAFYPVAALRPVPRAGNWGISLITTCTPPPACNERKAMV